MNMCDEWSGLASFLADIITKYIGEIDLESLPDPDRYFYAKSIRERYMRYMLLSAKKRMESGPSESQIFITNIVI